MNNDTTEGTNSLRKPTQHQRLLMQDAEARMTRLLVYLRANCFGRDKARKNNQIGFELGYPDLGSAGRQGIKNSRLLTQDINKLRLKEHPICADNTGIFLARWREEALPMVSDYTGRIVKYQEQLTAIMNSSQHLPSLS